MPSRAVWIAQTFRFAPLSVPRLDGELGLGFVGPAGMPQRRSAGLDAVEHARHQYLCLFIEVNPGHETRVAGPGDARHATER